VVDVLVGATWAPIALAHEIRCPLDWQGGQGTEAQVKSIYRILRLDRRITFDARFWLAAAARFDTIRGLTRDALFETGEDLGALRSSALAAGATLAALAGASSCVLISTVDVF